MKKFIFAILAASSLAGAAAPAFADAEKDWNDYWYCMAGYMPDRAAYCESVGHGW